MYVRYPKVAAFMPDGNALPPYMKYNRHAMLYFDEDTYLREDPQSLYFREHRRKTFSDVCHAKLVAPSGFDHDASCVQAEDELGFGSDFFQDWNGSSDKIAVCYIIQSRGSQAFIGRASANSTYSERTVRVSFQVYARVGRSGMTCYYKKREFSWGSITMKREYRYGQHIGTTYYASDDCCKRFLWLLHQFDYDYSSLDVVARRATGLIPEIATAIFTEAAPDYKGWWQDSRKMEIVRPVTNLPAPEFLLHEPDAVMDSVSDLLFGKGTESYFRNAAIQNAYLEAVRNVPRLNDNSISNVLEIAQFIKALVMDRKIEIPKSLDAAWLAYRYQYTTTKLDAEEAIKFVHRHMDLGDWKHIDNYGSYTFDYKDTTITCRCCLRASPKELDLVGKIWRALYTYGLSPSFYNLWDTIPYSFIVDWFIPIGQVATAWDAEREYNGKYNIEDVIFSLSYYRSTDRGLVHYYTRWYQGTPTELQGQYFLEYDSSTRTQTMRTVDALALTIGQKGG